METSDRKIHGAATRWIAAAFLVTTLGFWIAALFLPIWEVRTDHGEWRQVTGALPALIGWLGLLAWCPAWFANVLLIPGCITLFRQHRLGLLISIAACALAMSAYAFSTLYGDNEEDLIVARQIGFYFWLGAFFVLLLGHVLQCWRSGGVSSWQVWAVVCSAITGIFLLEHHFQVGIGPLEWALKDSTSNVEFIAAMDSHPSQAELDGALRWTVLRAVGRGADDLGITRIERLVRAGASVNQCDRHGTTLLMEAVSSSNAVPISHTLIKAAADVRARDSLGKTALDIAKERKNHPEYVQMLLQTNPGADTQPTAQ